MLKKSLLSFFSLVLMVLLFGSITSATAEDLNQEKLRYRANFSFDYVNGSFEAKVRTKITDFNTGKVQEETYKFTDKAITPVGNKSVHPIIEGKLYNTPTGLKAYALLSNDYYGGTIYEYSFETNSLRKIKDIKSYNRVTLYPSIGIYTVEDLKTNSQTEKLYRLSDNGYITTGYHIARKYNMTETCSPKCKNGDYILHKYDAKHDSEKYIIGYNGKLTPVKINYASSKPRKASSDFNTRTIPFSEGKLISGLSVDVKKSSLSWINKKGIEKVLIPKGNGYMSDFGNPSISPNNKYMVVNRQIKEKGNITKSIIYIFDIKQDMKLIKKFDAHYRISFQVNWYTDDLLMFVYNASYPAKFPSYYYNISKNVSTKSQNDDDAFYSLHLGYDYRKWDNFSYEGLTNLNDPKPKK